MCPSGFVRNGFSFIEVYGTESQFTKRLVYCIPLGSLMCSIARYFYESQDSL